MTVHMIVYMTVHMIVYMTGHMIVHMTGHTYFHSICSSADERLVSVWLKYDISRTTKKITTTNYVMTHVWF